MKKIFLISSKDGTFYNFRSELILELVNRRYDVTLICPYGPKIEYFTKRGCHFIDLDIDRRGINIYRDIKLLYTYNKILHEERPNLVLTYTTKCSIYAGIICRRWGIQYIVNNAGLIDTGNSKSLLEKILRILYKIGFKKASCMMYQNSHERDVLNGILKNKVHYRDIPGSGVDLTYFSLQPYPENDDIITFNYVARIVKTKGIDEFLECAKRIKYDYPNTRFVLYGDYDDDGYHKIIESYQEKGIVEYRGTLLDIKPAIVAAHAVIHPSYYEGMTNVVLEHSAMGRPCIGSDVPGVYEGIDDGETGYVFKVKDVNDMEVVVKKFIELPHNKKAKMGAAARKKMERQFDRYFVTTIYLEEIQRILEK